MKQIVKQNFRKVGLACARTGKKYAPTLLVMSISLAARAQEAAAEIDELSQSEIMPLVNSILGIAIILSAVWCAITFMMGKKTALTIGGFILLGALVFRLFPKIIKSIMGIE